MWLLHHAAEFTGGAESPDGSPWSFGGYTFATNPRFLVQGWEYPVVDLWQWARGDGMGGGVLPEAGGTLDQAAKMLDAFRVCDRADHEARAHGRAHRADR